MHTQSVARGGKATLKRTKPTYVKIDQEYADGDVLVNGELWKVKPSKDPRAGFETYDNTQA